MQFTKHSATSATPTLSPGGAPSVPRAISSCRPRRRTPRYVRSTPVLAPTALGPQRLISVSFRRLGLVRGAPAGAVQLAVHGELWLGRWGGPEVGPMAGNGLGGGWSRVGGIPTPGGATE